MDAVRAKYALSDLLQQMSLPRSSYYLCRAIQRKRDKYQGTKEQIRDIFTENREIYGYRRIKSAMERLGTRVSEKVIRRLMKEMHLTVKQPRRARYSSYKGEITPAADNLIDRDFKAPRPNEKWLTDITEFGLSDGKVYLSPMIALTACRLPGRLAPLRMPIWSIQCWIRQLPCCRRTRSRLFIPTAAVITAGRGGSGECRLRGSDVPCQRKDVHRITLPARAFSGI